MRTTNQMVEEFSKILAGSKPSKPTGHNADQVRSILETIKSAK